jgi:hypothetical protein
MFISPKPLPIIGCTPINSDIVGSAEMPAAFAVVAETMPKFVDAHAAAMGVRIGEFCLFVVVAAVLLRMCERKNDMC